MKIILVTVNEYHSSDMDVGLSGVNIAYQSMECHDGQPLMLQYSVCYARYRLLSSGLDRYGVVCMSTLADCQSAFCHRKDCSII